MKVNREDLLLYAITDRSWLSGKSLASQVEAAIKGGVTFVQLREKHLHDQEFIAEALALRTVTQSYGVPLIIDDRVDIMEAVGADGVHVGQQDGDVADVRKQIGPDKILGVSARTVQQAIEAEKNGADYLGTGAVFGTLTKDNATAISMETVWEICRSVSIPVVAIGGITEDNVSDLGGSGVCGIAVISALFASADIQESAARLKILADEMTQC